MKPTTSYTPIRREAGGSSVCCLTAGSAEVYDRRRQIAPADNFKGRIVMLKEYDGLPDIGSRYVLECRCKKIGEDGREIGACEDTVNPVSGFIYAENEEQAVNYGIDFIMKYAGDNLLLEDNSILLLDDNRPMDLYYDFSAVEVG